MTATRTRDDLAAQLREILAARGITSIPYNPDTLVGLSIDIWAVSTITRREMLDALPEPTRAAKIEAAKSFGVDLDARDVTPVRIARPRHTTWSDDLTYDAWLTWVVRDLDPRYELRDQPPATELRTLHDALLAAEATVTDLRARRDQAIRDAIAGGMSAYRIAQTLGISQPAVAKIRDARGGAR